MEVSLISPYIPIWKQKTVFFPTNRKEIRLGFFIPPTCSLKKTNGSNSPSNSSKSFGSTSSALPTFTRERRRQNGVWGEKRIRVKIVTTTKIFGVKNGLKKTQSFTYMYGLVRPLKNDWTTFLDSWAMYVKLRGFKRKKNEPWCFCWQNHQEMK